MLRGFVFTILLAIGAPVAAACGKASWYGGPPHEGRKTASGESFRSNKYTAAHRSIPFGTKLRVTYKGKSVVVKVNDRGPYVKGRVIDLSKAAAEKLGFKSKGVATVCFSKL